MARPSTTRITLAPDDTPWSFLFRRRGPWWQDWELYVLLLVAGLIFFTRVSDPAIRGEESRRGRIAWEMLETGDWVVPRTQGVPLLSRPPLQNWAIAFVGLVHGAVDDWAIRLPSLFSVLGTTVLLYGYSRQRLAPLGSFAAAGAYLSMLQVLELGRLGETEAMFTFLVSASLLLWHWGYLQKWPDLAQWVVPYLFVALGVLCKGPQAPIFFAGSVGLFLFFKRQEHRAVTLGHLAGLLVCAGIVSWWQLAFVRMTSWDAGWTIHFGDVGYRFADNRLGTFLTHLVVFPVEVFAGALAPWSFLLLAYAFASFRRHLGPARETVQFLTAALVVTFVLCWLPPGSRPRYLMPMFPAFAVLVGIVVQRSAESLPTADWQRLWPWFVNTLSVLLVVGAAVLLGIALLEPASPGSVGWPLAGFALAAAVVLAIFVSRRTHRNEGQALAVVITLVTALGLGYTGPIVTIHNQRGEDAAVAVAQVRAKIPQDVPLVSFGWTQHFFLLPWGQPVARLEWPRTIDEVPAEVQYFCFTTKRGETVTLPFAWEKLGVVSNERVVKGEPHESVVIGRRLDRPIDLQARRMKSAGSDL